MISEKLVNEIDLLKMGEKFENLNKENSIKVNKEVKEKIGEK